MNINLALLYVADLERSVTFYQTLLNAPPVDGSEKFAMFRTEGAALGLWLRSDVDVPSRGEPGATEINWVVAKSDVDRIHGEWSARKVAILLPPTDQEFGRTFLAVDPDGHRLRVLCPAE